MDAREHEAVEWLKDAPTLRDPLLIAAFAGWNDGGQAATAAVRWLARNLDGERLARISPERFHVFTEEGSRPQIRRRPGGETVLRWPGHDIFTVRTPEAWSRDLVVLIAREPDLRWRTYCEALLNVARRLGVSSLVTLGAFLAPVPHTRPAPVSGFAGTPQAAARLREAGALATGYEGPTGIVSVIMDLAAQAGLETASVWAAVPHYLPTTANPKAALALLRVVRAFTAIPFDLSRLEDAAQFFEGQVSEAVRAKGEVGEHVRRLEEADDKAAGLGERPQGAENLPNAADVIKAFEDLLRGGPGEPK
jgi:proteasome assembly chaperone (PAC2) family protein